jgi:hypothetical protein
VENLIRCKPILDEIYNNVAAELQLNRQKDSLGTQDDYIYDMAIGNKALDNMPPTGKISDSTGSIAIAYPKVMKFDRKCVKGELIDQELFLTMVLSQIDISLRRISPLQRRILDLFYWQQMSWKEICDRFKLENAFVQTKQLQDLRKKAIEKMVTSKIVTTEMYEKVMSYVENQIATL